MKRVSLDTNLLVLFCVGSADEASIVTNKRLQNYSIEDYRGLAGILSSFDALLSTPHSLAEVSNLLNISQRRATDRRLVQSFVDVIELIQEIQVAAKPLSIRSDFAIFGLADSAWLEYLDDNTLLLSADEALVNYASSLGKKAEWFRPSKQ